MLDFTKPITTRAGAPVRVLCTDRKITGSKKPVVVLVTLDGYESLYNYPLDGRFCTIVDDRMDLVNPPASHTFTQYIAVYKYTASPRFGIIVFPDKPSAVAYARSVAKSLGIQFTAVQEQTFTVTEGEGL